MGLVNALLVRYANGFTYYSDSDSITAHGLHEGFLSLGQVADLDEVERTCEALFAVLAEEQTATTAVIEPVDTTEEPYSGYLVGESVLCPDEDGVETAQEVVAVTVTEDPEGNPVFAPELGSRIKSADELLQDWQERMAGGTLGGFAQSATPASAPGSQQWGESVSLPDTATLIGGGSGSQIPVGARVRRAAAQSIATGSTPTALSFDTEVYDTQGLWSSGAPTRLIAPISGYYAVAGFVQWATATFAAGNYRYADLAVNGATGISRDRSHPGAGTGDADNVASAVYFLNAGDYVELRAAHQDGASRNATGALAMQLIAPAETDTPAARMRNSVNQSIPNNTATTVQFDTTVFDTAGMAQPANDRLVIPSAGVYEVGGWVQWASHATGRRSLLVRHVGATVAGHTTPAVIEATRVTEQSASAIVLAAAGDVVELIVIQESGGSLNLETNTNRPAIWAVKLQALQGSTPTAVRVSTGSVITVPNATQVAVTYATEAYDYANMWGSGAPTRITIPTAGVYRFLAHSKWDDFSTGYVIVLLRLNGTTTLAANRVWGHTDTSPNLTDDQEMQVAYEGLFVAGDYVEVVLDNLNTAAGSRATVGSQWVTASKVAG